MEKSRGHSSLAKEKALLNSDGISKLPDDILVDIIGRLGFREAARTSMVCSRWKYFWTFTTVLNFDPPRKLWHLPGSFSNYKRSDLDERRSNYISWVNKVLQLHRIGGSGLSEFIISFDLHDSHQTIVTDWIYQAIAKKVEKLSLDLSPCLGGGEKLYTLPQPKEWYNIVKAPPCLSGIRSLTSLSLVCVDITRETLEFFIYNCPLLERLQVQKTRLLSGALKLVGPSIQLKYLDIYCCFSITEIEISAAPSLLSFKFHGSQINLNIENVPLLVDVCIGGSYYVRLKNLIAPVRTYFTQLETLELRLDLSQENIPSICEFELPKLKHLIFGVVGSDSESLIQLTGIIKVCPFLYKFTLKSIHIGERRRRKLHEFPRCFHQHLKVLELIGFVGSLVELEFAFYILKNAITLEKIIVNPTSIFCLGTNLEFEETEKKQAGRERAKQLKERVPRGVEFILL